MALSQTRLTKSEWDALEIPISSTARRFQSFLVDASKDKEKTVCSRPTLVQYTKLSICNEVHCHLYITFLKTHMDKYVTDKDEDWPFSHKKARSRPTISKADIIRINNTTRHLSTETDSIVEFILLDAVATVSRWSQESPENRLEALHGIKTILSYPIPTLNPYLREDIGQFLKQIEEGLGVDEIKAAFRIAPKFLLNNKFTSTVWMYALYPFQKNLISMCSSRTRFVAAVSAPTGRGKTITPIALLSHKRIIFVCAARHVGLALAKSAISIGKKIAFAFNCASAADIRLHYSSAKESIRDYRTGGIRKVDNAVGDNVELMICDIKSALIASYYMCAFNSKDDLLLYWDEPTISLDVKSHPLHEPICDLWHKHPIPNVVLSSATLPSSVDMTPMLRTHTLRFNARQYYIECGDVVKSVGIIGPDCTYITPHSIIESTKDLRSVVNRLSENESLLRYISLEDAQMFQIKAEEVGYMAGGNSIAEDFPSIDAFSVKAIKLRYLSLLRSMTKCDFDDFISIRDSCTVKHENFSVLLTTQDAHTLTNGPTIYLANNVEKVAVFLLQNSKIAKAALNDVYTDLDHNNKIVTQIEKLEKELEDQEGNRGGEQEKREPSAISRMIGQLRLQMREAKLHSMFVPNSEEHLRYWAPNASYPSDTVPFMPNISQEQTSEILSLPSVGDKWKLLLLLGIGLLDNGMDNAYIEKMKELASGQKLFLIIAGSNYIFGTNYQFAHAFIGKDMSEISQDKIVQCIGRVGRTSTLSSNTVRLRSHELGRKLFAECDDNPELDNMMRLFT